MPRNGSGVFSLPAGSLVSDGETGTASQHNTPLSDLETDMNTARPIVAGGTGATTAGDARTNLAVPGLAVANTFTANQTISGAAPYFLLYESDQSSGDRGGSMGMASGNILFHAREDNGTVQTELATLYRNGTGMDIGATPTSNGGWTLTTGASSSKFHRAGTSANADLFQAYSLVHADPSYTEVFKVQNDGDTYNYNGTYGSLSDSRLKENIVDANPQLDDVLAMRVRNFNRVGSELKQIGLIAQELQAIKPGLVEADADGWLGVKYSVLVPILIKAVQELAARLEALEA